MSRIKPRPAKRKLVVTGISRLTGEREMISRPMPGPMAEKMFMDECRKPAKRRAFIYLRLREYPYEEERLKFGGGG